MQGNTQRNKLSAKHHFSTSCQVHRIKLIAMLNAVSIQRHAEIAEPRPSVRAVPLTPDTRKQVAERQPGKIMLPTMEGLCFEKIKHVNYLEASGNYTILHFTDARQVLVCKTLREVEMMLPDADFARIHRSHTIHLKHLKKYVKGKGGYVILQNGATLTVSSGQKEIFLDTLKTYFGQTS
jgi:DNA-binding LytR/AlgR family response regulator